MRKLLALAVSLPLVASFYLACSGDNSTGDAGDGPHDVKAEKPVIQDTGPVETGPTCAPDSVFDGGSLIWAPPHAPQPTACSDQQLADFWSKCWDPNTRNTNNCNAWKTANPTCLTCMYSTEGTDQTWGTIINTKHGVVYTNLGGCIALEQNDLTATGCGAKYWLALDCQDDSCTDNGQCPITDTPSFQAYQACTQQAAQEVCKSYISAECDLSDAGALQAACGMGSNASFQTYYNAISKLMCGGYPADAGTDGGTDAGADASDAGADAPDGD